MDQINIYNSKIKNIVSESDVFNYSSITFLLHNTNGFLSRSEFNSRLVKTLDPTFLSLSEIMMRANDADSIHDHFPSYSSLSQTPDTTLSSEKRMKWRPCHGVSLVFKENWSQYIEKVHITT